MSVDAVASGSHIELTLSPSLSEEEHAQIEVIKLERIGLKAMISQIKQYEATIGAAAVEQSSATPFSSPDDAMRMGRKKFNINPKKGMKFMFEHKLIKEDPVQVAKFLHDDKEVLSKISIGDYLGLSSDFHIKVMHEYVAMLDFRGLDFLPSLRKFLFPFRLPGESAVISRFLERFALQFREHCPESPICEEGAFILSYSVIMLNTDLHNDLNKNKMTMKQFLNNNRGINNGENIPKEVMKNIYKSIQNEEFVYPKGEDGLDLMELFYSPERCGFLHKQGGRNKNWKKRWCLITANCLYYFKEEKKGDESPLGIVPLEALSVRSLSRPKYAFEIYNPLDESLGIKSCKTKNNMVVEGHHATFVLYASDEDEKQDWVRSLKASMSNDPCYDLFRKARDASRLNEIEA